jgi:hypothetical protein
MTENLKAVNDLLFKLTYDELHQVARTIPDLMRSRSRQAAKNFGTGDTVKFTSTRTGTIVNGSVLKVAQKYVSVKTSVGVYKVPAGMLDFA